MEQILRRPTNLCKCGCYLHQHRMSEDSDALVCKKCVSCTDYSRD